ncbi:MAG: TonB-dependent receptor [Tannerella sp.]|jgi:TonB-linked SusC/RagA family outer membrane protein|nr:TonB-dependent receptor [Tannerella sp.]
MRIMTLFALFLIAGTVVMNARGGDSQETSEVQQSGTRITGTVVDQNGEPVTGANIVEKDARANGTITGVDGKFSLNVSPGATLVVSYIGYVTQEVPTGNRSSLSITLVEDTQALEEVVVVGYGVQKKSDVTGAVSRVNFEDKTNMANMDLGQALSGIVSGVSVNRSGRAGSEPSMTIRTQHTLSAGTAPLIVLDGIIYNGSVSDISVNDIETIDILKDASAAAVYGSRSANGVVIISTKKGRTDKPQISFNMYYGFQEMSNTPMKVMNAEQYAVRLVDFNYQQQLYEWYAKGPTGPEDQGGKPVRPDVTDPQVISGVLRSQEERDYYLAGGAGTDWVDLVQRDNAAIQNYNINYSGKSDRLTYFASVTYTDEQGILKNDQFKRYALRSNVESRVTPWLTTGLSAAFTQRDYSGAAASLGAARSASPLVVFDDNDPKNWPSLLTGELYMAHPFRGLKYTNESVSNNTFLVGNAKIDIPFIRGLSYNFDYSYTLISGRENNFYPSDVTEGTANNGKADRKPYHTANWIYNHLVSYIKAFGDHSVNATFLYSREKRNSDSFVFTSENFDNPELGFNNMGMGTLYSTGSADTWQETAVSYMARLNYALKGRYLATATVRRDGFSVFGPDSKYVTLPSLSLGWVLSEESFLKALNFPYMKLRLSYGQNGNQGAGRYSSFARISSGKYIWGSDVSITAITNVMGNSTLRWEKTASFNIGLDYAFLDRRIYGNVELYQSRTTDVLVQRNVPRSTGYTSVWTNLGAIDNKGIELEINSDNIRNKDFSWKTGVIFSLYRDEITKLYGDGQDSDIGNSWFVGQPISAIYDYKMAGGVWTEEDLYAGRIGPNGTELKGWYPGQYKYVDLNGDQVIDSNNDRNVIGYGTPNYRFSISNTLSCKNWGLYVLLNSIQGGNDYFIRDNYGVVNTMSRGDYVYRQNQSAVRPYWTPDNGVNNATGIYNAPPISSGIYESRSFVRLQDVSLSYNVDSNRLKKWSGIGALQIYLSGRNLYTWTQWSGWDPETISVGDDNPLSRNFILGFKLTF